MSSEISNNFSYVVIPISLIVGVAVADIMKSLSCILKYRAKNTSIILPTLWMFAILLIQLQYWWQMFEWCSVHSLKIYHYYALFVIPCVMYLISDISIPSNDDFYNNSESVNILKGIINRKRLLFSLGIIIPLSYIGLDFLLSPEALHPIKTPFRLLFIIQLTLNLLVKNENFIKINTTALFIIFIILTSITDNSLVYGP